MAVSRMIQARVPVEIQAAANAVIRASGLTVSDVVRVLMTRIAQDKMIPPALFQPNAETLAAFAEVLRRPSRLRVRELFAQLNQVGITAIPVVALVTSLIGVVMAYMLGLQAERFGASIFVVDGVALGMTREFSPLIVATIMAGRSGAAS